MPHLVGAIALVRRDATDPGDREVDDPAGRSEWLALHDRDRGELRLPQADKLEGESYRDALVRALDDTAGLDAGRDVLLSHAPRAHIQFAETCPGPTNGDVTVLEFYLAEPFRRGRAKLAANAAVRWLTAGDLVAGEAGGVGIAADQLALLKRADLRPPREG